MIVQETRRRIAALVMSAVPIPLSTAFALAPQPPAIIVEPLATASGCMIQSTFGTESGHKGNFEVVVLQGHSLVHYWHPNNDPSFAWRRGLVISTTATGPGCIIQSDFGKESGHPGNLEVVVQEGDHITHYFHDSSKPNTNWVRGLSFGTGVTGGPSLIQSDFKSGQHGNFEVVVPEGRNLVHYWHDNSDTRLAWQRGQVITSAATGGGTIIQSDFKSGQHGNFEVLVQEGDRVTHYWHDNSNVQSRWQFAGTFASGVTGSPTFIQGTFGASATGHGNFEAAVRQGGRLVHWFKNNGSVANRWTQGQDVVVDGPVHSAGSLIQSTFGNEGGRPGNFEVVVLRDHATLPPHSSLDSDVQDFDLVHYFHLNDNPARPWGRGQTVTYRGRSEKVCQLTGGLDKETLQVPTSNTATLSGLGFTDLGYPVDNGSVLSLYFGDSRNPQNQGLPSEWAWDDVVGTSVDRVPPTPVKCLTMSVPAQGAAGHRFFLPLKVAQQAPTPPERRLYQGLFNVPASGFTANGIDYTLFWTNHCAFLRPDGSSCLNPAPDTDVRGAGRLTRRTGQTRFKELYSLPPNINYTASLNPTTIAGTPANQRLGVYIWGVDRYRNSNPTLALVPESQVENPHSWQFFAGFNLNGMPVWRAASSQAQSLFREADTSSGCVGEFSVAWVQPLQRWLMLYNCGGAIRARLSRTPWGPWSEPTEVFRPDTDKARCRFEHAEHDPTCTDQLGGDNGTNDGDPYAPFVLSRFTRAVPHGAEIFFLMSTWNPYQVVVMHTVLAAGR